MADEHRYTFGIGVLHGRGRSVLSLQGDVAVHAREGALSLCGDKGVEIGNRVDIKGVDIDIDPGELVAFLDDDAEAAPDWLERLAAMYDDPEVLAVGGRVEPRWQAGRPGYFAERRCRVCRRARAQDA